MKPDETQPAPARRGRRLAAITAAVVLVLAAAAAGVAALRDDDPITTVTEVRVIQASDDDSTVRVDVGEPIELRLEENPTTGYQWKAHMVPDDDVLETRGDGWKVDDDCKDGMTGCGGVHTWRYWGGDEPGTTRIAFDLHGRQPGEIVEQFAITVQVG